MKNLSIVALLFALITVFAGTSMAADGASIYKSKCLACHGLDGKGTAMAPAFVDSAFIADSEDADIVATIKDGRNGSEKKYKNFALGMPPQKSLTDDELAEVVTYLKSLTTTK